MTMAQRNALVLIPRSLFGGADDPLPSQRILDFLKCLYQTQPLSGRVVLHFNDTLIW